MFGTNSGYCDFYATCDEYPDDKVRVISYDGVNFGSDFIRVKYRSEVEDMLNDMVIYSGDRLKVLLNEGPQGGYEEKDMTFEEYLGSGLLGNFGI